MSDSKGKDEAYRDEETMDKKSKTPENVNAGRWTREEHNMFLHGLETHGKEWKKIADLIKTRSVVQIRTHAQKYFQKVAKHTGGPVMSTSKKEVVVRPPSRKRKADDKIPNSIMVPPFSAPGSVKSEKKADGGATPRTVAAATILLRPRVEHKIETGGATPKTREIAAWLAGNQDDALQVLEKRRRSAASRNTPSMEEKLSWGAATTASRKRR